MTATETITQTKPQTGDQLVCHCHQVTESEIKSVIHNDCVDNVKDIGLRTKAGTGCTGCHCKIQRLLAGKPLNCGSCSFCHGCKSIRALCACED